MAEVVAGIRIPDSKLAREATDLLREHGTPLLYAHSLRVYLFGAIRGRYRGLTVDRELLYFGAVFHDLGLTAKYRSPDHRFEVDSANAARDFLRANGTVGTGRELQSRTIVLQSKIHG
jgi:HD domain